MKDYDEQVFWLDYFDSSLTRAGGRRIPISIATKSPSLEELATAARKLGFQPLMQKVHHPSRPTKETGYVQIKKKERKEKVMMDMAKALAEVRSQSRR